VLKLRSLVLTLAAVSLASAALAADAIPNWAAPASWSPASARGGLSAMDATSPLPFIGLAPCRIVDTRGNGAPIQGGMFTGGADVRSYLIPPICGVPAGVSAVSLNFTVTGPGQTAPGFLLAWPTGGAVPPVSILNWDHVPAQIANAAVVPTNGSGSITVNVSSPTHLIVDINGYYASTPATSSNFFSVINSGLYAIYGQTSNTGALAAGVYGTATAGSANGVFGFSSSTSDGTGGVFGWASSTIGKTIGILGETDSTTNGARGVFGLATSTVGVNQGVRGFTSSATSNASGVFGAALSPTGSPIGVLGASQSTAGGIAVAGSLQNTAGAPIAQGALGLAMGTATDSTGGPWGVFAFGNLGAMGAKHFVEPHANDPARVIVYSSLEGREVGTYFRGTARVVNHEAVIEVPEDFRMVTDEEGVTVQLTPVGAASSMFVESLDLNQIVVKASRDVTFYYLVQGVRRAFKDLQPVQVGYEFVPQSPTDRMPLYLTEEARRRLIANGTYNADGTVNMQTAERLGWTKAWAGREGAARAAPPQDLKDQK
jgi:hypothetical protein